MEREIQRVNGSNTDAKGDGNIFTRFDKVVPGLGTTNLLCLLFLPVSEFPASAILHF
jgi:hypothetical protein